jgi:tetratricopeptide (TPR) repeat protein
MLYTICCLVLGMNALHSAFSQNSVPAKPSRQTTSQAHAQTDDAPLTNQAIIGMVRSKVGTGVIINSIKASPGRYSLDPKSLIQLSAAGVPEAVIEAMQAEAGAGATTASTSHSHSPVQATSTWVGSTKINKLDGTKAVEASRSFSVESGGLIHVTATCQNDPSMMAINAMPGQMAAKLGSAIAAYTGAKTEAAPPPENPNPADPRSLSLSVQYVPARGSKVGLSVVTDPLTYKINENAFSNTATATPQSGGGRYVPMRVTVDGAGRSDVRAGSSGTPVRASFSFYAATTRDQVNAMYGGVGTSKVATGFLGAIASLGDTSIASMKDALQAKQILVGVPLTDGDEAVVEIEPQEASFLDFTSKCLAAFPGPASAGPGSAVSAHVAAAPPVYNSQWYEEQGATFLDQRDYNSAVVMFEQAIRMDKNNALAQRRLAIARRLQGSSTTKPGAKTADPGQTVPPPELSSAAPPVKNPKSGSPAGSVPGSSPPPSPLLVTRAVSTAEAAYANGNYIGAIGAYNQALALDPVNVSAKAGLEKAQKSQQYWTDTNEKLAAAGEVVDPKNKLMWALTDNGKNVDWKDANAYCQALRTGGYNDWRMPQIAELANAYSAKSSRSTAPLKHAETSFFGGQMAVDPVGSMWDYHINGGIVLTGPNVWSGTSPGKNTFSALFFSSGKPSDLPGGFKRTMRALCVRSAEQDSELGIK